MIKIKLLISNLMMYIIFMKFKITFFAFTTLLLSSSLTIDAFAQGFSTDRFRAKNRASIPVAPSSQQITVSTPSVTTLPSTVEKKKTKKDCYVNNVNVCLLDKRTRAEDRRLSAKKARDVLPSLRVIGSNEGQNVSSQKAFGDVKIRAQSRVNPYDITQSRYMTYLLVPF